MAVSNEGSEGQGMKVMKVLIGCETSGVEREAFRRLGHDVTSCDILPADDGSPHHYQGDIRDLLGELWDLAIMHPPCTYLANSGVSWLYSEPLRWQKMLEGADFFRLMFTVNSPRIAVENPVQHKWAKLAHGMGDHTQTIQPYHFGHPESKRTAYWLRGLPPLVRTDDVTEEFHRLPKREQQRLHWLGPSEDRWKLRSKSFEGVAEGMASQWGSGVGVVFGDERPFPWSVLTVPTTVLHRPKEA